MQSLFLAASVVGLSAYALPSNATTTASPHVVYTTEVVTALTTYCPAATTLTYNSKTYTITSATTLTITDCPCTIHKPVPTGPAQDECAKQCVAALYACKGKPDANQSSCVSAYNSCLGFQAIGGGKADYSPSACSKKDNPVPTGQTQDECAKKCVAALGECKSKPDANQSSCVSAYNSCLGFQAIGGGKADYSPSACSKESSKPTPTGQVPGQGQDECAKKCVAELSACKGKPNANQSTCVSNYNGCLGYEAIGNGKADYSPSCCSKDGSKPTPTGQTPGQGQDECAKKCVAALGDCKAQPGANQSTCVSNYNTCLGYQAIGGGKADYSPSACSKNGGSTPTSTAQVPGQGQGQSECAKKCVAALGDCKAQPGANQSTCVSNYNTCLGYEAIGNGKADYSPSACSQKATGTGTGVPTVPTVPVTAGAAEIARPVGLFLVGAALLL